MATNQRIALDEYQWDILLRIVAYSGIENIAQLLTPENRLFLNLNEQLKRAINRVISDEDGLQYNNRIDRYSFLHMYLRTPNCIDKTQLKFLDNEDEFLILYNYCVEENLPTTLNIAYYMWTSTDMVEFRDLVSKLRASTIKFNIELEFDTGFQYLFNGQQFFESLTTIGSQVKSLVIDQCNESFGIDMKLFSNMENLSLHFCSASSVNNLQTLKLKLLMFECTGSEGANHLIDALPPTLETFQANAHVIFLILERVNAGELQLPQLETITFWNERRRRLLMPLEFLKRAISSSTKHLELKSLIYTPEISGEVITLLEKASMQGMKLQLLSLNFGLDRPLSVYPTKSLTITKMDKPDILAHLQYPPTLKRLDLSNNSIEDLSLIIPALPLGLEFISFEHNPISWSTYLPNFAKFAQLNYLRLMNTHIGKHFLRFQFPDSLEILSLEVNQIESIDHVKFPKNLVNLGIGSNKIKVVYKPRFPPTIQTIHFTENNISKVDLSTNHIGQPLQITTLYLNYNRITSLKNVKLPLNLIILNFDNCCIETLLDTEFGKTIEELSFSGCEIKELKNITFESGSRLKYLCLSGNQLRKMDLIPPQSVTNINLSSNGFTKIPPQLANLRHLKYLSLAQNKLRTINFLFQTSSLKELELSYNSIHKIQLSFPQNTNTNLRLISLSSNELSRFTIKSIGHDDGKKVRHNKFSEIDLSQNHIMQEEISSIMEKMPTSTQCLWYYKDLQSESQFGDDFVLNTFPGGFLVKKRCDVPAMT